MKHDRFDRWLHGERDSLLNRVELRPQTEYEPSEEELRKIQAEHEYLREKIFQVEQNYKLRLFQRLYRVAALVFCVVFTSIMLITVSWLPKAGDPSNPANPDSNEVSARYIERGLQETGAVNIVTGMILDYRAFDTFGESNVLFVATITVMILLRSAPGQEEEDNQLHPGREDVILMKVAGLLVPVILIFGVYVILNGHLSPGGGFSGGTIIGAGLILYVNAFGFARIQRFFTERTYKTIWFCALTFYCLAKSYSFFTGANHLESGIPLGTPGAILSSGLILPLNICVGLVVACTMYAFYALFRKGGF